MKNVMVSWQLCCCCRWCWWAYRGAYSFKHPSC